MELNKLGGTFKAGLCMAAAFGAIAAGTARAEPAAPAPAAASATAETAAPAPTKEEIAAKKAADKAAKAALQEQERQARELKAKYGEGPYPGEVEAFVAQKPEALKPLFSTLFLGGERNAVLNLDRLGLAAMQAGEWKTAERAFDGSLMRIEQVYSKNKQAEQAKSVWKKEARKDFKGEPYERAMAYYYRGLLYLRVEDFDNARASFKQALFQDSINQDGERGQDFVVMNYLAGWSSACAGDNSDANEQFGYATKSNAKLVQPATGNNTLFVAELGRGPVKAKSGQNAELLEFQSATGVPETAATYQVKVGAADPAALPTIDAASLSYQASDRDGRKMDGVLKGKANTKAMTSAMGDAMIRNSYSNNSGGALGGMFAGLLMKGLSSAMHADADIRMWDSLPERIALGTRAMGAPAASAGVVYADASGGALQQTPAVVQVFGGKKCSLVWSRSRSALDVAAATPGDDAKVATANASRKDVQLKDKAFRESLANF